MWEVCVQGEERTQARRPSRQGHKLLLLDHRLLSAQTPLRPQTSAHPTHTRTMYIVCSVLSPLPSWASTRTIFTSPLCPSPDRKHKKCKVVDSFCPNHAGLDEPVGKGAM